MKKITFWALMVATLSLVVNIDAMMGYEEAKKYEEARWIAIDYI